MSRPIEVNDLFWEQDFIQLSKIHKNIQIKLIALHHIQKGKSYKQVSEILGICKRSIQLYLNTYAKEGLDGLQKKVRKRRKDRVYESFNILEFKELFLKEQALKEGGRLTGTDAKRIIQERFNQNIGLSTTYKVLHDINLSYITGRDINPKMKEDEQIAFKKTSKKM